MSSLRRAPAALAMLAAAIVVPKAYAVAAQDPVSPDQQVGVTVPSLQTGEFVWSVGDGGFVDLTQFQNAGSHLEFVGDLREVVVADGRPGAPAWSLHGQVGQVSSPLSARAFGWAPAIVDGAVAATAGPVVQAAHPAGSDLALGLSQTSLLASAAAGHAPANVRVGAELTVRVPVDTPAGTYAAVLTLTALG